MTIPAYSLNSYTLAVRTRSKKTLLVEGTTDVFVINGIKRAAEERDKEEKNIAIDDVSIIRDQDLSGLGNREKVIRIASRFNGEEKFRAFVDREWDGFDLNNISGYFSGEIFELSSPLCMTKGHSVENYFFDARVVENHLSRTYPHLIDDTLLQQIKQSFSEILQLAFSFSWATKEASIITRSSNIISRACVLRDANGALMLDIAHLEAAFTSRGVLPVAWQIFLASYDETLVKCRRGLVDLSFLQWIAHGHLGEGVIWACLAFLLNDAGFSDVDCTQVQCGLSDEKLRSAVHQISRSEQFEKAPVSQILEWANS